MVHVLNKLRFPLVDEPQILRLGEPEVWSYNEVTCLGAEG